MAKQLSGTGSAFLAIGSFILILASVNNNVWLSLTGFIIIILGFIGMKKVKKK